MKTFRKDLTVKQRRELLARFFSVVLSGIMLFAIGIVGFAWFSTNSTVSQTGMNIIVSTDAVDILVERTIEYDAGYDGITGANGLKAKLGESGYSTSVNSTQTTSKIAFELFNEYVFDGKRYLMPGAYGTMTFYVRPKPGQDGVKITFGLERGAFADGFDERDNPIITEVSDENILNLINGHILFFESRTGADQEHFVYGGFIEDGFSYDTGRHSKCDEAGKTDCYKIVLYWEWPITYYDMSGNLSTESPLITKKYPAALGEYLTEHTGCFFVGADISDEEAKYHAYNHGDQSIGDAVDYFVVYLKLQ
ncbi:MAG: hypothetical protein J6Y43_03160 [Clostridia bacterium]|nr:hypothetical protein [Clostridia bacterium]